MSTMSAEVTRAEAIKHITGAETVSAPSLFAKELIDLWNDPKTEVRALRVLAGAEIPDSNTAKKFNEHQFTTLDRTGGKLTDATRKGIADGWYDSYDKLLKGDMTGLGIGGTRGEIERCLKQDPFIAAQYAVASSKDNMIAYLFQNPAVQSQMSAELKGLYAPDRVISDDLGKLRAEEDQLSKQVTELGKLEDEYKEFTSYDNAGAIQEGRFVAKLKGLEKKQGEHEEKVAALKRQMTSLESQIKSVVDSRGNLLVQSSRKEKTTTSSGAVTTEKYDEMVQADRAQELKNDRTAFESEYKNLRDTELPNANRELQEVKAEIKAISDRKSQIESRMTTLKDVRTQLPEVRAKIATAETNRTAAEAKWLSELGGVVTRAVATGMNELTKEVTAVQAKLDEKKKTDAEAQKDIKKREEARLVADKLYKLGRDPSTNRYEWNRVEGLFLALTKNNIDGIIYHEIFGPNNAVNLARWNDFKNKWPDDYDQLIRDVKEKIVRLRMTTPAPPQGIMDRIFDTQKPREITDDERRDVFDALGNDYFQKVFGENPALKDHISTALGGNVNLDNNPTEQFKRFNPNTALTVLFLVMGITGELLRKR